MNPAPDEHSPLPADLAALADALKKAWREGNGPDAAGAIQDHPSLLHYRSLALGLVYEDYCVREERGLTPELEAFCQNFPTFLRSPIRDLLRGHRTLADHPELFSLLSAPKWPNAGDRIEGLLLIRLLGQGTFARVYLARDAEANRTVVVKLSPLLSGEAQTQGPIHHPHVSLVHWARRSEGFSAICMPYVGAATLGDAVIAARRAGVHGRSARTILDEIEFQCLGDLPEAGADRPPLFAARGSYGDAVVAIAIGLADALESLQRKGIAHGDVKPSNIVLGRGGHPYLIDFNLASGPNQSLFAAGGTLPYMPPERLRAIVKGRGTEGTPAQADVYAFGIVLYETLTGTVPFEVRDSFDGEALAADQLRLKTRPAEEWTATWLGVPRPLIPLIRRCLAAEPADRPTARVIRRSLQRYAGRWHRRRRVMTWATAAAVLLAFGFVSVDRKPNPIPPDVVPVLRPSPVSAADYRARGREYLASGDTAAALSDFLTVMTLDPTGPSTGEYAYCLSIAGHHPAAVDFYRRAINQHGYEEAWVRNNLAYSLARKSTSPEILTLSEEEATRALVLKPHFRAARLNRAFARYNLHFDSESWTLRETSCVTDMEAALALGPPSAGMYHIAALMLAASAHGRDEIYARAVGLLRSAVGLGLSPEVFAEDPVFEFHLAKRPDYREVLALHPSVPAEKRPSDFLADPFAD